uniref:Sulfotransferase n=1 Tax=Rubinisphaera brasiliensis (strain ATCC 49424 / DSM 5305 / JCM 21570 / IAM 15109 / NBRC 103401 / IFAM 1448) TaxID=756272 RepID=F0SI54_RUBBR|nr:hypothetical protein Plabr_4182 [Rubinisphaera brasiliensis DSM 5305]
MLMEDPSSASSRILAKSVVGNKLCIPNQIELHHHHLVRLLKKTYNLFVHRLYNRLPISHLSRHLPILPLRSDMSISQHLEQDPDLFIIGMIRPPQECISSMMTRSRWGKKKAFYHWYRSVTVLHALTTLLSTGSSEKKIFLVHYSQLVKHPEQVLSRLCSEIGLAYSPRLLDGYKHTPQYKGNKGIDSS